LYCIKHYIIVAGLRRQHPMNYEPVNYKNTPKMKAKHDRLKGISGTSPYSLSPVESLLWISYFQTSFSFSKWVL